MNTATAGPAVSVVIPTYNRAADLRRCLGSLTAQTFKDFEVLVCDDGSTDDSAAVADEFAGRLNLSFGTAENFGGPARPRNRGVAAARAPYIAFLDSDDWWAPAKLERSVAALEAGADIVYHDLFVARSRQQERFGDRIPSSPPQHPMFYSLLCTGISIPNSSVVVRTSCLAELGGICEDKDLVSVEDLDTWIRLARITENFVRLPECLGYYWTGGGNISSASPKQIFKIKALYARHLEQLPPAFRRRAEGFLAYRIGRIAQQYGDRAAAREHLLSALEQPIDLRYRARALWFLTRSFIERTPS